MGQFVVTKHFRSEKPLGFDFVPRAGLTPAAALGGDTLLQQSEPATAQPTPTPAPAPSPVGLPEMPYSANFHGVGQNGFDIQYTVRGVTEDGFVGRVDHLIQRLVESGFTPAPRTGHGTAAANGDEQAPVCAIHAKPMTKVQGNKGSFWLCHERLQDESYCPYKAPKV